MNTESGYRKRIQEGDSGSLDAGRGYRKLIHGSGNRKWIQEVYTGSVYRKLIQEVDTGSRYMKWIHDVDRCNWIEDVDRGRG